MEPHLPKGPRDTFNRGKVDFSQQCPARYATGELSQCKLCKGHPSPHQFDEAAYPGLWAEYVKLNPREEQVIRATAYDKVLADREALLEQLTLAADWLTRLGYVRCSKADVNDMRAAIDKAMGRAE